MENIYYKNKYLKYKKKYIELQNEQKGGVVPVIYCIFYSSKASICDIEKYKYDETFPNFNEFTNFLGPTTYYLANKSNKLTHVTLKNYGFLYSYFLKYVKWYSEKISKLLKEKNIIDASSTDIEKIIENLNIDITESDSININSFWRFGVNTFKLDKDFFETNKTKITNIMKLLNSKFNLNDEDEKNFIDSILIIDSGTIRNGFVGSHKYLFNEVKGNDLLIIPPNKKNIPQSTFLLTNMLNSFGNLYPTNNNLARDEIVGLAINKPLTGYNQFGQPEYDGKAVVDPSIAPFMNNNPNLGRDVLIGEVIGKKFEGTDKFGNPKYSGQPNALDNAISGVQTSANNTANSVGEFAGTTANSVGEFAGTTANTVGVLAGTTANTVGSLAGTTANTVGSLAGDTVNSLGASSLSITKGSSGSSGSSGCKDPGECLMGALIVLFVIIIAVMGGIVVYYSAKEIYTGFDDYFNENKSKCKHLKVKIVNK